MRRLQKWLIPFIGIVIFQNCQSPKKYDHQSNKEKLEYQDKKKWVHAKVLKQDMFSKEILSNGVIVACQKAKLVFKVDENIQRVFVRNGDRVKHGQVLVQLQDYNQKLNLEKAKNQLLKSEIELKNILLGYNPNESDTSNINANILKTARSRSGYYDAFTAINEAKYFLSQTLIKAPFDGIVASIQAKENNFAGNYNFFAYVLDNRQMELEFGILESELEMLERGINVLVIPYAFPDRSFRGTINEINPSVDENGMIKVKAIIPNQEGILLDGMNAEVIAQIEIPKQLVVPKEAVLLRQDKEMIFTLKNDSIAQWVYVKTGFENSNQFTITEGLQEGDTIIISNNFNLGHDVIVNASLRNINKN